MSVVPLIAFTVGAFVGAAITALSVERDDWWAQRLGRTRWRRANLPAGGTVVTVVAVLLDASGPVYALAAGLAVSAVAWRWVEPLPVAPAGPDTRREVDPVTNDPLVLTLIILAIIALVLFIVRR